MFGLRFEVDVLNAAEEAEEAIEQREGMGRAAGDIKIDGNCRICAVVNFRASGEGAAADGAGADGNHQFGRGDGLIGFLERELHVFGHGARDQEAVRVARRSHELDPEAAQIIRDNAEDVGLHRAAAAVSGGHLPEL